MSQAPTRDRLIVAATELFWQQGFDATPVSQILTRAQANPGSLYHYFRTKEALLNAVLERYLEVFQSAVLDPVFATAHDPMQKVLAVFEHHRATLLAGGLAGGSPLGNLAAEVADRFPVAQQALATNFDQWVDAIEKCLDEIPLRTDVDRRQIAVLVVSVLEGGILLARAYKSLTPFDASVAELQRHIEDSIETND